MKKDADGRGQTGAVQHVKRTRGLLLFVVTDYESIDSVFLCHTNDSCMQQIHEAGGVAAVDPVRRRAFEEHEIRVLRCRESIGFCLEHLQTGTYSSIQRPRPPGRQLHLQSAQW